MTIMGNLDIRTILEYYALLCLILTPASLWFFIVMSRKTNLLKRIDAFVDRVTEPKEKKDADKPAGDTKPEGNEEIPESSDKPEMSGITCLVMTVGDTYHCRRNPQLFSDTLRDVVWSCDENFVGSIDSNGTFKALKAGKANIYCGLDGSMYDGDALTYSMTVKTSEKGWTPAGIIRDVTRRAGRSDMTAKFAGTRITLNSPGQGLLGYESCGSWKGPVLQFDRTGHLERAVIRTRESREMENLERRLGEYYERVNLKKGTGTEIWVRRHIDEQHDDVETYAIVKKSKKETVLGIAQNWREFGSVEEFLYNIDVAERLFNDCLGDETPTPHLEVDTENPLKMADDQLEVFILGAGIIKNEKEGSPHGPMKPTRPTAPVRKQEPERITETKTPVPASEPEAEMPVIDTIPEEQAVPEAEEAIEIPETEPDPEELDMDISYDNFPDFTEEETE